MWRGRAQNDAEALNALWRARSLTARTAGLGECARRAAPLAQPVSPARRSGIAVGSLSEMPGTLLLSSFLRYEGLYLGCPPRNLRELARKSADQFISGMQGMVWISRFFQMCFARSEINPPQRVAQIVLAPHVHGWSCLT